MGQCYGQLGLEERVEIYRLHAAGRSQTKLRLRLTERHRRSVGSYGATPGLPRSGPGATSLSGLSNWLSAGDDGMAASNWHASRTCETAWAIALRWDIPRNRSLADWRWNMA